MRREEGQVPLGDGGGSSNTAPRGGLGRRGIVAGVRATMPSARAPPHERGGKSALADRRRDRKTRPEDRSMKKQDPYSTATSETAPAAVQDLQSHWLRVVGRRGFLMGVGAAGAATLPGSALLPSEASARDRDANRLTDGDVAILRFLAAAELIESDLWAQYTELGGVPSDSESPAPLRPRIRVRSRRSRPSRPTTCSPVSQWSSSGRPCGWPGRPTQRVGRSTRRTTSQLVQRPPRHRTGGARRSARRRTARLSRGDLVGLV